MPRDSQLHGSTIKGRRRRSVLCPPLPFDAEHWDKVIRTIGLSKQQARVAELVLRDLCNKQIAAIMGLSEKTIDTYLERIGRQAGTHGRMQLAMRVLAISHEVRS